MIRPIDEEEFGEYTYGYQNIAVNDFQTGHKLKIGKFCSISFGVMIFLGGDHPVNYVSTYPFSLYFDIDDDYEKWGKKGDVTVGNDVWIGYGATIMPGVNIGDGSVIAANSHVVKDVEPYCIYGGNPAKFIKKRFTDEQISKLLKIKWWDLEKNKIDEIKNLLHSENVEDLLSYFKDT
jgi:virginiamycin A acetyltransferase